MLNEKKPKVGLALGSGSARGFAHIGVLQELERNGIRPDIVTGCSMGAVIGGIYASGTDLEMLRKLAVQMNSRDFIDFMVPRRGLVKGARFEELIAMLTKHKKIEDAEIPFACVACDLREGRNVTLKSGYMHEAIRASMSIPAIFEPFELDGVLYVDGGVFDSVPIEAARQMGADIVIGVDVGCQGEREETGEGLWEILFRALDLMGWAINGEKVKSADILITPKVLHVSKYTNDDAGECINIGEQAAKDAIPDIKKAIENWAEVLPAGD